MKLLFRREIYSNMRDSLLANEAAVTSLTAPPELIQASTVGSLLGLTCSQEESGFWSIIGCLIGSACFGLAYIGGFDDESRRDDGAAETKADAKEKIKQHKMKTETDSNSNATESSRYNYHTI